MTKFDQLGKMTEIADQKCYLTMNQLILLTKMHHGKELSTVQAGEIVGANDKIPRTKGRNVLNKLVEKELVSSRATAPSEYVIGFAMNHRSHLVYKLTDLGATAVSAITKERFNSAQLAKLLLYAFNEYGLTLKNLTLLSKMAGFKELNGSGLGDLIEGNDNGNSQSGASAAKLLIDKGFLTTRVTEKGEKLDCMRGKKNMRIKMYSITESGIEALNRITEGTCLDE